MTPFELAPAARAVIGDNGLKEVQKSALVDGFILTDRYGASALVARTRGERSR
jgi:hypothetical protein